VPAVHCGATLTKSTTLTADLVHCPGTGLVIGADGITVNLAGHTISGTNAPGSEGIANDGHAATRILAGRITDFREQRRHAGRRAQHRARTHHSSDRGGG
jgi:hypothetical protein